MKPHPIEWFKNHANQFTGPLSFDEPLAKHTYYRIGGPAAVFAIPKTLNDLDWLSEGIRETNIRYFILGQGSNVLASDQGYPGLMIRANRLNTEITPVDPPFENRSALRVRTGASVVVSSLLRRAAQDGWSGFEFLTGIPGSVGGAVTMNAGTHLGETQSKLKKVEVHFLIENQYKRSHIFVGDQLQFQYRKNLFLPPGSLIWAAEWEVELKSPAEVKAVIDETLRRRKATQPVEYPSCGSVFKNPKAYGWTAWKVIDHLGLRGHRIGDAQFAEKHSNFIINLGKATATDVKALIQLAKTRAHKEMSIVLEEEVIYLD